MYQRFAFNVRFRPWHHPLFSSLIPSVLDIVNGVDGRSGPEAHVVVLGESEMGRQGAVVLYVVVMVAVIVGVDFAFFRHRFWERLIANIGIVMLFAAFYLRFLK